MAEKKDEAAAEVYAPAASGADGDALKRAAKHALAAAETAGDAEGVDKARAQLDGIAEGERKAAAAGRSAAAGGRGNAPAGRSAPAKATTAGAAAGEEKK